MFKVLDKMCTPNRGTKYSAYVDLFASQDVIICAGETKVIPLGVKINIDGNMTRKLEVGIGLFGMETFQERVDSFKKSHYLEVALKSSLAVEGLIIANGIGIIDLGYPDEIGLIVHNPITDSWNQNFEDGTVDKITHLHDGASGIGYFKFKKGDKVAQCTLKEHKSYLIGYEE